MDRNSASAEVLLARIQELEVLNRALFEEKEQETRLEYAWSGNLGHWYWNVKTNAVTFNPLKVTALGYTMDEVPAPVPFQFFTDRLHPENYEPTMRAMRDHLEGKSPIYEVEYRIRA
jgi:PAS domain-containing protein